MSYKIKLLLVSFFFLTTCLCADTGVSTGADNSAKVISGKVCEDGVIVTIPAGDICRDKFGTSSECTICAKCGDGILIEGAPLSEQCEGASGNQLIFSTALSGYSPLECNTSTCVAEYCGDGISGNTPGETCDGETLCRSPKDLDLPRILGLETLLKA